MSMDYPSVILQELRDAIGDVELTEAEERTLKRLAGWDYGAVCNIASIIHKAKIGRAAGELVRFPVLRDGKNITIKVDRGSSLEEIAAMVAAVKKAHPDAEVGVDVEL